MSSDLAKLARFFIYIFVPVAAAFATYGYMSSIFFEPVNPAATSSVLVEVTPDMSFRDICQKLEREGLVKTARSLNLYARLRGTSATIKPGEYVLTAAMTPRQLLEALVAGRLHKRPLRIQEGSSVWEIGAEVERAGLVTSEEFNPMLTNPELLARAGIGAGSFEGYFAPALYEFARPITAERIIWAFIERGESDWTDEFTAQADFLRMSRHEILTLASIIEMTSQDPEERRLVSSVLHNRLRHGMRLQSDVTVIYGLRDFDGVLTDEDRSSPSPYNTYLNYGLPPGPICNPGEGAIIAALRPAETEYLFYLPDIDGGLRFSETIREYNELMEQQLEILSE